MEKIEIAGKSYRVSQRVDITEYPNLAAYQPDVRYWVYADHRGAQYVIRELKNGTYSLPKRL